MNAAHFIIEGRVQGVGFRAHTQRKALQLGLTGIARNLEDGRVEVLAQGEPSAIAELAAWLQHGPALARVASVQRRDASVAEAWQRFEIG